MDNQQPSNNSIYYQKPNKGKGIVYKYTSPSGKSYIGQTVNSLAERAKGVISGKGYKKCSVFWKAIQKYSFTNFSVEILCEVPIDELNEWEKYYISFFNTLVPKGYNLSYGGKGGKKKEVYVYSTQNGKLIEHYSSLCEAAEMTGVPVETISSILSPSSKRKQSHNLTFSTQFFEIFNLSELLRDNLQKVYVYDNNGFFYKEFNSIQEASKILKVSVNTVSRRLKDGKNGCGYYFQNNKKEKITNLNKQQRKGKKVCQICPITYETVAVYSSLASAARSVGLSSGSAIGRAISRNGKSAGYYWRIIEGSTTMYP